MKNNSILLLFLFFSIGISAQNVTMAKAFYKKAQIAYENKNYQEVINLLEKTKENLDGETNPDIVYLEAKSRLENDINIQKAKKLFKYFINNADKNDERIDEVSGILVDIEVSKELDKFGNFYNRDKRIGIYKTFHNNGVLKDSTYYKGYEKLFSYSFFENGKTQIIEPFDGDFIQYYESGNIQFYGKVKNGLRRGIFDYYEDGEYEGRKESDKEIRIFLSSNFFDANSRDMDEYEYFLKNLNQQGVSISEGYSDYNLEDYDIIIWSACTKMKNNNPFFSKVDNLLSLGKYIIICASNACIADRIEGKYFYSTSAANILLENYGIKFDSKDDGFNKTIVSNGSFFDKSFSFLGWRYPDVSKSKYLNKNAKYVDMVLVDENSGNGMMAVYSKPRTKGKLFTYGSDGWTFGLGTLDKSTGERDNKKTYLLLKQIIDDYVANK